MREAEVLTICFIVFFHGVVAFLMEISLTGALPNFDDLIINFDNLGADGALAVAVFEASKVFQTFAHANPVVLRINLVIFEGTVGFFKSIFTQLFLFLNQRKLIEAYWSFIHMFVLLFHKADVVKRDNAKPKVLIECVGQAMVKAERAACETAHEDRPTHNKDHVLQQVHNHQVV